MEYVHQEGLSELIKPDTIDRGAREQCEALFEKMKDMYWNGNKAVSFPPLPLLDASKIISVHKSNQHFLFNTSGFVVAVFVRFSAETYLPIAMQRRYVNNVPGARIGPGGRDDEIYAQYYLAHEVWTEQNELHFTMHDVVAPNNA